MEDWEGGSLLVQYEIHSTLHKIYYIPAEILSGPGVIHHPGWASTSLFPHNYADPPWPGEDSVW